jgi:hypothetical protein
MGLSNTLVDALQTMHNGKFFHLPIVDQGNTIDFHFVVYNYSIICVVFNYHVICVINGQTMNTFCLYKLFLYLN